MSEEPWAQDVRVAGEGVKAGPGAPRGTGEGVAPSALASAIAFYFPWDSFSSPLSLLSIGSS